MSVILKPGREKSLLRRHPWIFSGAIHHADENIPSGSTVDLLSSNKQFLARASYSPNSQIRARVWTFEEEAVDEEFFRRRIVAAIGARSKFSPSPLTPLPVPFGDASRGEGNMEMNENKDLDSFACALYCLGVDVSCNSIRSRDSATVPARGIALLHLWFDTGALATRSGRYHAYT